MPARSDLLRRDVILGALLAVFGLTATVIAARYPYGSARDMGPGFIPYWLGWIIAGLGLTIAVAGFAKSDAEPLHRPASSVLALIPGAILLFGLGIDRLGLLVTTGIVSFAVAMAWPGMRLRDATIAATVLAIAMTLIFVTALRVPLPVWPR